MMMVMMCRPLTFMFQASIWQHHLLAWRAVCTSPALPAAATRSSVPLGIGASQSLMQQCCLALWHGKRTGGPPDQANHPHHHNHHPHVCGVSGRGHGSPALATNTTRDLAHRRTCAFDWVVISPM